MTRALSALALLLLVGRSAPAHRLDEYLQGTILSVGKNRLEAEITLTPGVAVFPVLIADIDRDADGTISETEQHSYSERVLGDVALSIDGHTLKPHLAAAQFPAIADMKEGRGEIRIGFYADLPPGAAGRRLIFQNHHQSSIAAYQVNVLVPRDPAIRIVSQKRNYTQSFYELDFEDASISSGPPALTFLVPVVLIGVAWSFRWASNRPSGYIRLKKMFRV